jgi:hypothetical protein
MASSADAGTSFVFVLCQSGAETVLQRDVSTHHAGYAATIQRPGLVTFRSDASVTPETVMRSAFAPCDGQWLGTARDAAEALALLPAEASPPSCCTPPSARPTARLSRRSHRAP